MPKRVICGADAQGIGTVLIEGPLRKLMRPPRTSGPPPHPLNVAWIAQELGNNSHDRLPDLENLDLNLKPGETRFLQMVLPPKETGGLHKTPHTVDYVTILSGNTILEMQDGSSTHLAAGDMVVQLSAHHRWSNITDEACIASVLILGVASDPPDAPARIVLPEA